ncbi:unnamed protein product [Malus baccata var. baccata]
MPFIFFHSPLLSLVPSLPPPVFRSRVANCKTTAEPLVMNLSGEALDAYNEDSPCSIFETFSAQNHSQTQSEEVNGSVGTQSFPSVFIWMTLK